VEIPISLQLVNRERIMYASADTLPLKMTQNLVSILHANGIDMINRLSIRLIHWLFKIRQEMVI
jgi:hypothetical protein